MCSCAGHPVPPVHGPCLGLALPTGIVSLAKRDRGWKIASAVVADSGRTVAVPCAEARRSRASFVRTDQLLGCFADHHAIMDMDDEVRGSHRTFGTPNAAVIAPHSPPLFLEGCCNSLIPLLSTRHEPVAINHETQNNGRVARELVRGSTANIAVKTRSMSISAVGDALWLSLISAACC
jgi:hypothetical protein